MQSVNALGIKVAGLTAGLLLVVFGLYTGTKTYLARDTASVPLAQVQPTTDVPATGLDSDNDGLADRLEPLYRTDKANPDTDGDGIPDGLEITQGKDPSVAGIRDESRPVTGKNVINPTTYTQRYLATLPEDIPRTDILRQEKLEAFVNTNKGQLLPTIAPQDIKTTAAAGKDAVQIYLDSISPGQNKAIHAVTNEDIQTAFTQLLQLQPQAMKTVITNLEQNVTLLKAVEAPAEVVGLHTKLLAASQALLANTKLLQTTGNDFVAGLVGSKNIEELAPVFKDIATAMVALEKKYALQ